MAYFVDYDGTEYLIVEARGRLRHSNLLTSVERRGDMLLADVLTGALIIKPRINDDNDLMIHRHSGDKYLKQHMDAGLAYKALTQELMGGFMTSYLFRKNQPERKIFAADIIKNSIKVRAAVLELTDD